MIAFNTMNWLKFFELSLVFLIGFFSCALIGFLYSGAEIPLDLGVVSADSNSINAPGNWIQEKNIHVYDNAVVIDINDATLSRYADTGSMFPLLDENSNGIRIVPESSEQIEIGDIVTFEQGSDLIVHRVIEKGEDSEGIYFITKGDNNEVSDGKIRFEQIKFVTIGVLW